MRYTLGVLVLATALLGACSDEGTTVTMNGTQEFVPRSTTIATGDTLTFVNEGGQQHTVTAYEDEIPEGAEYFSSGGLPSEEAAREDPAAAFVAEGESFAVTLEVPGTYEYFCIPHEQQGMKGTIVVEG
jgi:plastocyanin